MLARRTKRLILGFSFLGFLLLLLLVSVARYFAAAEERRRYEEERAALKPRELYTAEVKRQTRQRTRRYTADVQPWVRASVAAEVAGRVIEVKVDTGAVVKAGEPMVLIDPETAEIELRAASAQLEAARLQAVENARLGQEAERLAKREVISKTELESVRARSEMSDADMQRLEAERDRLKQLLDRHTVKAPFDGLVRQRMIDPGDTVNMNAAVAELVKVDPLRVVFAVGENEVSAFKPGARLDLQVATAPGKTFHPEILHVSGSADPETRLFRVEAALQNPEGAILSGTQGVVESPVETLDDRLFVPTSAVRLAGQSAFVERMSAEGIPEPVQIQIGEEVDGSYPVLAGLSEGDRVVVR